MTTKQPQNAVEAMRMRPGMYVGDVSDGTGLAHLVWELVANSLDQHLAGRCRRVDVILEQDGSVVVEDDGPGIPTMDVDGRPFAEVALTQLHQTPTLDGHAPHHHVGRHGVGMVVVNALSTCLTLDVFRDGFHFAQRFAKGFAVGCLEKLEPTNRTGTRIAFLPDSTIFQDPWFNAGTLATRLRELAWLMPTLTLTFQDRREHVFHEPRGLVVVLERKRAGLVPLGGTLVIDQRIDDIRIEAAIEWHPSRYRSSSVESYANVEQTTSGGTHVEGLLDGLAMGLQAAVPGWKSHSKKKTVEAVKRGLHAIVCVRLIDPTYGEPTRDRLVTPEVKRAVSSTVERACAEFVKGNAALMEYLADALRA